MELLIIGIATGFNFFVLKLKADANRWADLTFDIAVLIALSYLFGGTMGGMTIAMIASFLVSIALYFSPPKFLQDI